MLDITELSFQHIHYFTTIVDSGTMCKAAEVLNVSQPLVSQKISQLEEFIGLKLFRRYKQRLHLTSAGKQLLSDFRSLESDLISSISRAQRDYSEQPSISLCFTDGQDRLFAKTILKDLKNISGTNEWNSKLLRLDNIVDELVNNKLDIATLPDFINIRKNENIDFVEVCKLPISCVMSINHPLSSMTSLSWENLSNETCLVADFSKNMPVGEEIRQNLKKSNPFAKIEYYDNDFMTATNKCLLNDSVIFSGVQFYSDTELCSRPLPGEKYSYIVAWNKNASDQIQSYALLLAKLLYKKISSDFLAGKMKQLEFPSDMSKFMSL